LATGRLGFGEIIKRGVIAGAAGGLAEVVWVSLYAVVTGGNAANIARGVTTAAGVTAMLPDAPVTVGIVVHMALAVLLGVALAWLWQALARRGFGVRSLTAVMLAALAAVWAMNFFVILPALSPPFIALIPYPVSLISKLLFGFAAAETLRRGAAVETAGLPPAVRVRAASGRKRHPSG
jgi:hypothetical protein